MWVKRELCCVNIKGILEVRNNMNYSKIYEKLIEKRRKYILDESCKMCENHHIIPVSEDGSNKSDNLIRLTIKEHIFAHQLLARIYDDKKMWLAARYMMNTRMSGINKCLRLAAIAREKRIEKNSGKNAFWYGKHLSEETRKKISMKNKGRTYTEEELKIRSEKSKGEMNGFFGKHHIEELRKRWSRIRKGVKPSQEAIAKRVAKVKGRPAWNKGIPHTEEAKRKISMGNKGKVVSMETRMKLSLALKGHRPSIEAIEKARFTQRYHNPKTKMVVQYDKSMKVISEYMSTREASRVTGISCGNISRCCNGKLKTVKGFIWRFK